MTDQNPLTFPIMVTDCSAPGVRTGLVGEDGWLAYVNKSGETGAVLFEAVKQVLEETGFGLNDLAGFAYCEGPGSTLGIRINAMALRTWNSLNKQPIPVFAYKSLEAAVMLIKETHNPNSSFSVFSDLRKNAWNGCRSDSIGSAGPIEVVQSDSLNRWPLPHYFIQQRIHSPGRPPHSEILDYDLQPLGSSLSFKKLLRPVTKPTVFQTTTTEFKKWVPQRHR